MPTRLILFVRLSPFPWRLLLSLCFRQRGIVETHPYRNPARLANAAMRRSMFFSSTTTTEKSPNVESSFLRQSSQLGERVKKKKGSAFFLFPLLPKRMKPAQACLGGRPRPIAAPYRRRTPRPCLCSAEARDENEKPTPTPTTTTPPSPPPRPPPPDPETRWRRLWGGNPHGVYRVPGVSDWLARAPQVRIRSTTDRQVRIKKERDDGGAKIGIVESDLPFQGPSGDCGDLMRMD